MKKIELEKINESYDRLGENLKEIFDSEETANTLMSLGKKYALHIDQIGQLTTIVHYVLLGFLPLKDFAKELKSSIGVSEDVSNLIIYDLNQQILSKIRQELEELSREQEEPTKTAESEQVLPTKTPDGQAISAPGPSATQVFDNKMKNVANVPKQEVTVTSQTTDNKVRDPYRESI